MTSISKISQLLATAAVVLLAACSSDSVTPIEPDPEPRVATVTVSPGAPTIEKGQSIGLTVQVKDSAGRPIIGKSVTWESSDATVATVSTSGAVVALQRGVAMVEATVDGVTGTSRVTVHAVDPPPPERVVASVELTASSFVLNENEVRRVGAIARDADGVEITGRAIEWTSSNTSVATVSNAGDVSAVREGQAVIRATIDGKSADVPVRVATTTSHDLMFDRWSGIVGNLTFPELFRLDIRAPGAAAVPVLQGTTYASPDVTSSPDGTHIAFVAAEAGNTFIYITKSDGTSMRRLTTGTSMLEDQPSWSPDGSMIAFRRWTQGGPPGVHNPADIWVAKVDGSGLVNLTQTDNDAGSQQYPSWSPDSRKLVYADETRGPDGYLRARLFTINVDGSGKLPITGDYMKVDNQPVWSPDGQSILFVRQNEMLFGDLWLVNPAGGNERALMANDPPGAQRAPAWSPDGRMITFISNHEIIDNKAGVFQVYTVRSDGADIIRRTSDGVDKQNPAWIRRP
jgi:hypothetical protein